jgi:hypothetical protein
MKKEVKFCEIEKFEYKNGVFEAGLLKNSPHKCDKIYLRINDWFFHLRDDEVFAIINGLSKALWSEFILKKEKGKVKWKTLDELTK